MTAILLRSLQQYCEANGLAPDWESLDANATISQISEWSDQHSLPQAGLLRACAVAFELRFLEDLAGLVADVDFVQQVPIHLSRRNLVMAVKDVDEESSRLVIGSIDGLQQADNLSRLLGKEMPMVFADPDQVRGMIDRAYQLRGSQTEATIQTLGDDDDTLEITKHEDLLDEAGKSSVIKLVNSILFDAVQMRASDVHVQPYETHLQIRFRIDGVLFDQFEIPSATQEEVISRIKVVSKMDIAEKRLPQDGRTTIRVGSRVIDLRVASLPTSFGERVVIRLLDKSTRMYTLNDLGMDQEIHEKFSRLIQKEHGLILVTGPTGCGKSTTLYASLQEINTTDRNVVTLEDPIEYQLPGISQTQVNEKKGMTFERGLRNILRQDPDIIMVGEIRDQQTAELAIQSALTGHMVFSTLHTNDAPSSITRLLELEIEPFLVSSSVVAVLAQRLVRRICEHCKTESKTELQNLDPALHELIGNGLYFEGSGCDECRQTGYSGRLGLYELMVIDAEIQKAIQQRLDASILREIGIKNGMKRLREAGVAKALAGETTLSEVARVTGL